MSMPTTILPAMLLGGAILAAAAVVAIGIAWGVGRLAVEGARRADRIESRLAALEVVVRRIEAAMPQTAGVGPPTGTPSRSSGTVPSATAVRTPKPGPIWPTLIAVPDLSKRGGTVGTQAEGAWRGAASADLESRFGRVWALAEAGAGPERIAAATGQPIGQVMLVLSLRRRLSGEAGTAEAEAAGVPA